MKQRALTTDRDHLVAELDRNTSIIVLRAYGPRCVVCGYVARAPRHVFGRAAGVGAQYPADVARAARLIECGHVFGRTHHSTRWDIHWGGNCYPQCPRCNQDHNRDRKPYLAWYRRTFGPVRLAALEQRWRRQRKFGDPELLELATFYRGLVAGQFPLPLRAFWPSLAFDALEVIPQRFRGLVAVQGQQTQNPENQGIPGNLVKKTTRRRKKDVANGVASCKMRPVKTIQHPAGRLSRGGAVESRSSKTTSATEKAAREGRSLKRRH